MKTGTILHLWKTSSIKQKLIALGILTLLSIGALGAIGEFSGGKKGGILSSLAETVGLKEKSNKGDSLNESLNPPEGTLQLSKEYIYAGSRMLATEDYGVTNGTPTPTATPTPTPPPNSNNLCLADMWTGGNSYLHPTPGWNIQTNGDLLSPTDNWFWAQSKMALSQVGDWVEFDYTPLTYPYIRTLDSAYYGYSSSYGYYTQAGNVAPPTSFAIGDKIKFQIETGEVIKVYKNGSLNYTFANPRDPNKPLYIVWGIEAALTQSTLLKRPSCGSGGSGTPTPTPPASTFSVTATPTSVQPNATVAVNWTANSSRPTTDWIGLYQVGAANNSYLTYQYIQGGTSGSLNFTMPNSSGNYEFRYFPDNSYNLVATSNQVSVSSNPSVTNIWQGGSAVNAYNYTILSNDDVIKPNGQGWYWIKSRVALSQVGDWAEFDYVQFASPRLGTNDLTLNFIYHHDWGFYTFDLGSTFPENNNVPFTAGDKFKYQLGANNQVQVYKNGTLVYTFQATRDPNKPLYIFWAQRVELPDGTTLKRPNFGGSGIIVN